MPFPDIFEALDFLDLLVSWRFWLPTVVGVGLGVHFAGAESPASAAVAVCIGAAGLAAGLVWQFRYDRAAWRPEWIRHGRTRKTPEVRGLIVVPEVGLEPTRF